MAVLKTKSVVPIGAVQGDAIVVVKVHDVRDIFQEIVIDLSFRAGHLVLSKAIPDLEQPLIGRPLIEAGGNQGGIDQAITLIGG